MNDETPKALPQPCELFVVGNGYLAMDDAQRLKIRGMIREAAGRKRLQVQLEAQWSRTDNCAVWVFSYKGSAELSPMDRVGLLGGMSHVLSEPVICAKEIFTGYIPRVTQETAQPPARPNFRTPRPPFS